LQYGDTALKVASEVGEAEAVKVLLEKKGAELKYQVWIPLTFHAILS
jgi:hypothetical protein